MFGPCLTADFKACLVDGWLIVQTVLLVRAERKVLGQASTGALLIGNRSKIVCKPWRSTAVVQLLRQNWIRWERISHNISAFRNFNQTIQPTHQIIKLVLMSTRAEPGLDGLIQMVTVAIEHERRGRLESGERPPPYLCWWWPWVILDFSCTDQRLLKCATSHSHPSQWGKWRCSNKSLNKGARDEVAHILAQWVTGPVSNWSFSFHMLLLQRASPTELCVSKFAP